MVEIGDLLALRASKEVACSQVRAQAEGKVAAVRSKIRSLGQIEQALERLIAECRESGHGSDCPILDELDPNF